MLTGSERSKLRAKGNRLEPVVHVGKEGLNQSVIDQMDEALTAHELVKGRVLNNSLTDSRSAAHELASACQADVVQVIGNVFILYRENPEESE